MGKLRDKRAIVDRAGLDAACVDGLAAFSHCVLLFVFDRDDAAAAGAAPRLKVRPPKGGGALLDRVLEIVRDRIKAEDQMRGNDELRCLAAALRCADDAATLAFLQDQLATSLDFAARFDAYVADAALFLESSGAATSADEARLDRVRAIRDFVVEIRRGMPV